MSTLVVHMLLPALTAASTGLFRLRHVWVWSWAAWAVDVDYLGHVLHVTYGWPNLHRALFHNVWILGALVLLAVRAVRSWTTTTGTGLGDFAAARPGWLLVPFFYASHLILDVFVGGISALWPLTDRTFKWDFELTFTTTETIPTVGVQSEVATVPGVVQVSPIYTWLTGEELAFVLLYGLSLVLMYAYRWRTRFVAPARDA